LRSYLIASILLVAAAAGQGCATQGQATRAAEQAAMESEDDAACQGKGAPESPAYDACRKELAEARAQQAAIQEQKRRDFDRVLGAGTDGQSNY
jgi:predicted secreted Zn-dependent protease